MAAAEARYGRRRRRKQGRPWVRGGGGGGGGDAGASGGVERGEGRCRGRTDKGTYNDPFRAVWEPIHLQKAPRDGLETASSSPRLRAPRRKRRRSQLVLPGEKGDSSTVVRLTDEPLRRSLDPLRPLRAGRWCPSSASNPRAGGALPRNQ